MLQTRSRKTAPRQQVLAAGEQTFSWVSHDVPHEKVRPPFSNTPHSYEYPTNTSILPWNHHLCHHIAWQHVLVFPSFSQIFPPPVFLHSLQLYHLGHSVNRCGSEGKSLLNTLRSNQQGGEWIANRDRTNENLETTVLHRVLSRFPHTHRFRCSEVLRSKGRSLFFETSSWS